MSRCTLSGSAAGHRRDPGRERGAVGRCGERYERLIATALVELAANPARLLGRAGSELADGTRIHHLSGSKRHARAGAGAVGAPRHFMLCRVLEPDLIGVARVLHDSMDLPAYATGDLRKD